jgi:hypothetical protein
MVRNALRCGLIDPHDPDGSKQRQAMARNCNRTDAETAVQFLTPDGQLLTVQHVSGPQQYAAPISPWALSASQMRRLRERILALEAWLAANPAAPWDERTRKEQELTTLRRELESAELEQRLERRR